MQLEMLHIKKRRAHSAFPPLLRGSNALPYDIFPSSPLHTLFSYLLSSLLSHFHPHTTYSLSFNCALATFRLLHIKRRLRCLFNGYNRVTIKTAALNTLPAPALIIARLPISSRTTRRSFLLPLLLSYLGRSLYKSVLGIFRL